MLSQNVLLYFLFQLMTLSELVNVEKKEVFLKRVDFWLKGHCQFKMEKAERCVSIFQLDLFPQGKARNWNHHESILNKYKIDYKINQSSKELYLIHDFLTFKISFNFFRTLFGDMMILKSLKLNNMLMAKTNKSFLLNFFSSSSQKLRLDRIKKNEK